MLRRLRRAGLCAAAAGLALSGWALVLDPVLPEAAADAPWEPGEPPATSCEQDGKARGVRLGRPVEHSPAVRALVVQMRESGATLQAIADRLTDDGVATPRGGRWHLATVKRILDSHRLDIEAADAADRIESEALLAVESFEALSGNPEKWRRSADSGR